MVPILLIIFISTSTAEIIARRDENWPPQDLIAPYLANRDICIKQTGANLDEILKFSNDRTNMNGDISSNLKCYMKCSLQKVGVMDCSGNLHSKPALEILEKAAMDVQTIILKMGVKCIKLKLKDLNDYCDRAYALNKCLRDNDPVFSYILDDNNYLARMMDIFNDHVMLRFF